MFMEIIDNSGTVRTINTDHIVMIFPDDNKTGLKLIGYNVIVHIDMDYKEFMDKFKIIQETNVWRYLR